MAKYTKVYKEMKEQNKELFEEFKKIHDKYEENEEKYQEEFNKIGKQVVEIIRNNELLLTSKSQSGQYAKYASNLADKFWDRVRKDFPQIDFVGTSIS